MLYVVLDCETATLPFVKEWKLSPKDKQKISLAKPLIYDIGWTVMNDEGEILKKVSRISASNGVFAFSTPNGSGWSRRKSLKKFLERSPEDHYTILTPRGVRKILRRYGYRVRKIRMTGIHPERIFSDRGADSFPTPIYRILCTVFRILRWGDTFEVYAQKK